ncbi:hypothetical protein AB0K05_29525 [Nonomuraea sp. NPDC049486]|uniref:hypothetical protein n=1 Tax=unclassified Nonomuraea TaxID=2593643 RepID=UPI00343AA37A
MSAFTDALMLKLHATCGVQDLLFPPGQQGLSRVRQLVGTLYGLPASSVHEVLEVEVLGARFQRPLFRPRLLTGTWTRTSPDHARTDVRYEGREAGTPPEWIDLSAALAVTLVLELDRGAIESITFADIGEFTTLAEFEAKFHYFDLAGYMARHRLETVDELRRAYRHLLGEIKQADPPPFDPGDPANQRRVRLELALLMRDVVDVTEALRSASLVRDLAERDLAYARDLGDLEVLAPLAPVLVFPADAVAASGFAEADLTAFFAGQDILAITVPP